MRYVLLIAWREFRQVVRTRAFWISLMVLPLALGVTFPFNVAVGIPLYLELLRWLGARS